MTLLIYGATGYTGCLCAEYAVERGLRLLLADALSIQRAGTADGRLNACSDSLSTQ